MPIPVHHTQRTIEELKPLEQRECLVLCNNLGLFGVSKKEMTDTEIRKQVNHIILIAKQAISKYKFGTCKNLYVIFESELRMRKVNTV